MEYTPATKGGRCWNGAHHDRGIVIHAIPGTPLNGFWGTAALCSAKPGSKGYGWVDSIGMQVTCSKCLKKMQSYLK